MGQTTCYYEPSPRQRQDWESDSYFTKLTEKEFLFESWELDALDVDLLEEAVMWLVGRHESLRAHFPLVEEKVWLVLHPVDRGLFRVRVTEVGGEEMERRLFFDNLAVVCDLKRGPLFRVYAVKMPDGRYKVTFIIHHIISDAWSVWVIRQELKGYYEGSLRDELSPAPRITNYCREVNGETERHRLYWQQQLKPFVPGYAERMWNGILSKAAIAGGVSETYGQLLKRLSTSPASCYNMAIGAPLVDELRDFARHRRVSLRNVLYLGLYRAYQKCFGVDSVLFASPVADRFHPKYKDLIGNLTAGIYLPLEMGGGSMGVGATGVGVMGVGVMGVGSMGGGSMGGGSMGVGATAEECLAAISSAFMKACRHLIFNHDDFSLDGAALRMSCNCFVNFEPSRDPSETLPEVSVGHARHNTSFYALACNIKEFVNGLTFMWTYKERMHGPADVEKLAAYFRAELREMALDYKKYGA
ncbi:MAG: hypothetical protein JST68_18585 [Bacteroidetes bacterium]|nr:hypothetical protein [Bacteroidota bacterium]